MNFEFQKPSPFPFNWLLRSLVKPKNIFLIILSPQNQNCKSHILVHQVWTASV